MSKTNVVLIILVLVLGGVILTGEIKFEVSLGEDEPIESNEVAIAVAQPQEPQSETWACVPNLVTNLFHDGFIRELTTGLESSGIKINSALGWRYFGLFDGTLKESCRVLPSYNLVTCITEVDENTGPYTDVVHLDTVTMVYNHTQIHGEGTTFTSGSCEIDSVL